MEIMIYPKLNERVRELRKNMTAAERILWNEYLRNFRYRVLRQRPVDNYIVNFYCSKRKLVIEVDGNVHDTDEAAGYDKQRDAVLQGYGLTVIRIRNNDVLDNLEAVISEIEKFVN